MTKAIKAFLPQLDREITFYLASDGWWENKEWSRAISPDMKYCIMDPYYGKTAMGVDAPVFDFEIVD